ncbi:MAG: hypothetical protein GY839_19790 [candidate division Zixibacteria bacterium]|nr:hypothetical protein [candidate division Zixibacteria bacterium]
MLSNYQLVTGILYDPEPDVYKVQGKDVLWPPWRRPSWWRIGFSALPA